MARVDTVGERASIPVGELASAAWRTAGDSLRDLWPVLVGWALLAGLNDYVVRLVQPGGARGTPAQLGVEIVSIVVLAVPSGLATRTLLGSEKPWWRIDRQLGAYVLVYSLGLAAIQAAFSVPSLLLAAGVRLSAGTLAILSIAQLVVGFVVLWVVLRLTLWPIGLLMGERRMTLGQAWRQMRGAVWPYLAAGFIVSILPVAALLYFAFVYRSNAALWALGAQSVISTLVGLLFAAIAAEIYRRRSVFGIGDVFD